MCGVSCVDNHLPGNIVNRLGSLHYIEIRYAGVSFVHFCVSPGSKGPTERFIYCAPGAFKWGQNIGKYISFVRDRIPLHTHTLSAHNTLLKLYACVVCTVVVTSSFHEHRETDRD